MSLAGNRSQSPAIGTAEAVLKSLPLAVVVIGPDGKIAKWYHGGDWQVSDLIKDAAAARAAKS